MRLPHIENEGEHLLKQCIRKLKCNCSTDIKISYYYTVKDKIHIAQRSSVTCQSTCPGCLQRYIGKTDCCFHMRMNEHCRKPDQPMYRHLKKLQLLSRIRSTLFFVM